MKNLRMLSASMLVVALGSAAGDAARAQEQPANTRGSVKVRARVFNPFAIGQSRISLSPFGLFTVAADPNPFAVSNTAPTTVTKPSAGGAATSGTSTIVATSEPSEPILATSSESGPEIAVSAVRPPFRPPARSPWRPPPRPPFIPP